MRHKGLGCLVQLNDIPGFTLSRELPAGRVRCPADMIAVTDSTADGLFDFVIFPTDSTKESVPGRVHGGGANVLFCDGHVSWYRQRDILVTYDTMLPSEAHIHRMWNNDHEPHQ
jgi:prepilin-type processing-associated H-X9-DG protein